MKNWNNFDWWLLAIPVIIVAFSCMMLYEISHWAANVPASDPYKQAVYFAIGLVFFYFFVSLDYKSLRVFIWPAYILVIAGLVFVSLRGYGSYGATRWINLGFIQLQPSEPAKLVVVLALASFFSSREHKIDLLSTFLGSMVIAGVPALLVLRQPDFGSAMVLALIWLGVTVLASVRTRYLVGLTAISAVAAPVAWFKVLKGFQRTRLTSFLHPNQDLLGANYGPSHAQIAVGSGGAWGQWFGKATQSRLNFLVFQDKDYIFSVIAEQIGFVGVLVLFSLFCALLFRIAHVAFMSADSYGRLIAGGVLIIFLCQTFINIGMNMGIMPVTGIPLPLLSYGGSSLITSMAALGMLESILLRHQKLVFTTGQSIL
jgi:rod shape determining protein RodA